MSDTLKDPEFLGKGWAFPIRWKSDTKALEIVSGLESIKQSIRVIAETSIGERVMRPLFGAGLQEYVFDQNGPATWNAIKDTVMTALIRHEPRIIVESVDVSVPYSGADGMPTVEDSSVLHVSVDYRVRTTNNRYNLVYPFYLLEGDAKP